MKYFVSYYFTYPTNPGSGFGNIVVDDWKEVLTAQNIDEFSIFLENKLNCEVIILFYKEME
jgi:hypothetical protein